MAFTLTEQTLLGLFYIQRYRYLSITQFAYITDSRYDSTAHQLRLMERVGLLGHFGNVPIAGHGKTPKVYFLTRKGHLYLVENLFDYQAEIGGYRKVKTTSKWSPQMFHNLKTTDCFLAIEKQIKDIEKYRLYKVFTESKMERLKGGGTRKETTDFIDDTQQTDSRIIPDGAFILERVNDAKRFIFFLELDNGTETLVSNVAANYHQSVQYKFSQYIKYLTSGRYGLKYKDYGEFSFFFMLFITTTEKRAANVSRSLEFIPTDYRKFFYISHLETVLEDVFFSQWLLPASDPQHARTLIKP